MEGNNAKQVLVADYSLHNDEGYTQENHGNCTNTAHVTGETKFLLESLEPV